jgi:hypothetical protein
MFLSRELPLEFFEWLTRPSSAHRVKPLLQEDQYLAKIFNSLKEVFVKHHKH